MGHIQTLCLHLRNLRSSRSPIPTLHTFDFMNIRTELPYDPPTFCPLLVQKKSWVIKKHHPSPCWSWAIYMGFFFFLLPTLIALEDSHRAAVLLLLPHAHRPIINMILYDSFQYTSIVVMLRWNKFQLKLPRDYDVHSSLWQLEDFLLLQSETE